MADCNTSSNFAGKKVAIQYAVGCGDAIYAGLTYLPLGTVNSKQLNYAAVTADNTNDLSGAVTSEIVVRSGLELTVSGFLTSVDGATSAQNALIQYYWDEIQAGRQPSVWIKISGDGYPRVWHIFMNYKGGNESFGTDDVAGGEFNFGVTDTGATNLAVNISDPA
jgi:hypothetical protein